MNPDLLSSVTPPAPAKLPPAGETVAELLDEYCRQNGIVMPTTEEAAMLPPWTDEEADAFARVIDEMFEQVDDVKP